MIVNIIEESLQEHIVALSRTVIKSVKNDFFTGGLIQLSMFLSDTVELQIL